VDVHGYGVKGAFANRHSGMQELGTAAGYVVVQPNNPSASWKPKDDDDRIYRFVEQLVEGLAVDRNRIHIGGFSQGGWMTWRFVCDHSDLIASAAPIGAGATYLEDEPVPGVSCDFDASGTPAEQVDILYVHGTADTDAPFETALKQRDLVIDAWDMTESALLADEPDYRWTRWTSAERTDFEFLEHDWSGGILDGHCYPGATGTVGCGDDTAIDYGETALAFYVDHPKNG
jgi:poly(3-hydroxybutyrate) depolymerase